MNLKFINRRVMHVALPVPPQVLVHQVVLGLPGLPKRKKKSKKIIVLTVTNNP